MLSSLFGESKQSPEGLIMLTDFIIGYEALVFETPADSGQGNVENVPP